MRELPPQAERSEPKAERAPGGGLASGAASSAYVPFPRGGTPSTTEAPPASTGSGSESTPDGETTPGGSSSQPSTGGSRPGPTEPPASNPAIVRMLAEATEVSVGAPVTIHVAIADASDVGSVPFHVLFDPAVLQYQRSEEGAFLQSGGRQTVFAALPTGRADSVIVGLAKLGRGDGVDGVGELCTLHFTAVGPGAADLRFERANVRDSSNRILQSSFLPVSVTVH